MGKLTDFMVLLNSLHHNIKFMMELEEDGRLPFLDILLIKKPDGTLGHVVFKKPTHTNLYVNNLSRHHPAQKHAVNFNIESCKHH